MKPILTFLWLCFLMAILYPLTGIAQQKIEGRVLDEANAVPLSGASIFIKNLESTIKTDNNGYFSLINPGLNDSLCISYIGYTSRCIPILRKRNNLGTIFLHSKQSLLNEVQISTGYQKIDLNKTTGAVTQVNNELLNRKLGSNILNRLEDVVPGLAFSRNRGSAENNFSIRGMSTLFANAQPLIILDNFPFTGDPSSINPNDIENITVLKDAAAASIWGARAGNGVVVISTKNGRQNKKTQFNLISNITFSKKPDKIYPSVMSGADYIEIEKLLFSKGFYKAKEQAGILALSPAVNFLIENREGRINSEELNTALTSLAQYNFQNERREYFFNDLLNQQYAMNLSGGAENQYYYLSVGLDHNITTLKGFDNGRHTFNVGNTQLFFKNRLELSTRFFYAHNNRKNDPATVSNPYPYQQLVDENGKAVAVGGYSDAYIKANIQKGMQDWALRPVDELNFADNTIKLDEYRIDVGLSYKILNSLKAQLKYQYSKQQVDQDNLRGADTYYTRDLINRFTQVGATGTLTTPVPQGGIFDQYNTAALGNNLRTQLDYNHAWDSYKISAIAGAELSDMNTRSAEYRLYGYDTEHLTNKPVDQVNTYRQFTDGTSALIPNIDKQLDLTDRFVSYYINGAFSYRDRFTLSLSGRIDRSNIFGVNTNQKGVPLYAAGIAWNFSKESFYSLYFLPLLNLRLSYGLNGNVDKTLSAFTTAIYNSGSGSPAGKPYATIQNPPNPELRWEKVKVWNAGLDFATAGNTLSGTIDLFTKKGTDLIGSAPFPPSSGILVFKGNTADTKVSGLDFSLKGNIRFGNFNWQPSFIGSMVKDKVTNYKVKQTTNTYIQNGDGFGGSYPLEGKPLYAIYSYSWAGLDHLTGDPMGYLNGIPSKDYAKIISQTIPENMIYSGTARPVYFGAFINNFSWKQLRVSVNVNYRLKYFFRRASVTYSGLLGNAIPTHGDYTYRWQKPGDEIFTSVPSLPLNVNTNRDTFYSYSNTLVEKADHIRLQDINLSYTVNKKELRRLPFDKVEFSFYASNLGILWKATNVDIDPDYPNASYGRMCSFAAGLKVAF
jgi:TonB-linked SusC/RagA family outer membrane protein